LISTVELPTTQNACGLSTTPYLHSDSSNLAYPRHSHYPFESFIFCNRSQSTKALAIHKRARKDIHAGASLSLARYVCLFDALRDAARLRSKKDVWICPYCKTEWHIMEGYELMPDGTKVCANPKCRRKLTDKDIYG